MAGCPAHQDCCEIGLPKESSRLTVNSFAQQRREGCSLQSMKGRFMYEFHQSHDPDHRLKQGSWKWKIILPIPFLWSWQSVPSPRT